MTANEIETTLKNVAYENDNCVRVEVYEEESHICVTTYRNADEKYTDGQYWCAEDRVLNEARYLFDDLEGYETETYTDSGITCYGEVYNSLTANRIES